MIEMQCKYAYKECTNVRTRKRDGGLHRLCEHHRNKANALQKVYATKRRQEIRAQKRQHIESRITCQTYSNSWPIHASMVIPMQNPSISINELKTLDIECIFDFDLEPIEVFSNVEALSDEECAYLSAVL